MTTEKVGKVWAISVIAFCLFYVFSACVAIEDIFNNFGISSIDRIFQVVFFLGSILLFGYAYENPQIMFSSVTAKKKALMTKRFWDDIKYCPDDKLDALECEIRTIMHNIHFTEK